MKESLIGRNYAENSFLFFSKKIKILYSFSKYQFYIFFFEYDDKFRWYNRSKFRTEHPYIKKKMYYMCAYVLYKLYIFSIQERRIGFDVLLINKMPLYKIYK